MGNYNSQYKKYYQNLQNNNMKKNNSPVYTRDSFEEVYGYKDTNKNKSKKKDFFESMLNVFIYQLVVVIFMLMSAFYLKYTPRQMDSYKNVKAVINDTTYSQVENSVESFNLSQFFNKISNYIKTNISKDSNNF